MLKSTKDHAYWRLYVKNYQIVASDMAKRGLTLPADWVHPDDLAFEDGGHVWFRGGDPQDAKENREYRIRLRELFMLQAEKDRRNFGAERRSRSPPLFVSEVLVRMLNSSLPKRLQMNDLQLIMKMECIGKLRTNALQRRLREGWNDFGIPDAKNLITPTITVERAREIALRNP